MSSDLLVIGRSGVRAYGRALATVSDNIANSQSPGYARRSVQLAAAPAPGDPTLYRNTLRPGGVLVTGVARAVDQWLVDDARTTTSDHAQSAARLSWLQATERALEDGGQGVARLATGVFNAADELSTDPSNQTIRAQFLQAAGDLATGFRRTAGELGSVATGIAQDGQVRVDALNADMQELGRINKALQAAKAGSTSQASLMDERDAVIDRIGAAVGVAVTTDGRGVATVRVAGPSAEMLVDGQNVATVGLVTQADGRIDFSLTGAASGMLNPQSGALAGLIDAADHVATQRTGLDTLAANTAAQFNSWHQAGRDAAGNPGQPLFDGAGGAATMALAALAPGDVAAADATRVNGNLLTIGTLRTASGIETAFVAQLSQQAQQVASAKAQETAAQTRKDGAAEARDGVSAVDLDTEAAELVRFQQAYDASARVIQVARETIQSILNIF